MKLIRFCLLTATTLVLLGCSASSIEVEPAKLGEPASIETMLEALQETGAVGLSKHAMADWSVPLSGLLNLDHPKAKAAGLVDKDEAISLYAYVIDHPEYGKFLVDSGISKRFLDAANNDDISFVVKKAMNTDALQVIKTTEELAEAEDGLNGVFLTHIHLDHIMGLTDVGKHVPVFIGADDASAIHFNHLATRGTTNRLLAKQTKLLEWQFEGQPVIDVFEDGSVWAIATPGHTPGSVSYLVNATDGVHLMVGDTTHTRWGWDNQVEPGSYTMDNEGNVAALALLAEIAEKVPNITVHPGHQP